MNSLYLEQTIQEAARHQLNIYILQLEKLPYVATKVVFSVLSLCMVYKSS